MTVGYKHQSCSISCGQKALGSNTNTELQRTNHLWLLQTAAAQHMHIHQVLPALAEQGMQGEAHNLYYSTPLQSLHADHQYMSGGLHVSGRTALGSQTCCLLISHTTQNLRTTTGKYQHLLLLLPFNSCTRQT